MSLPPLHLRSLLRRLPALIVSVGLATFPATSGAPTVVPTLATPPAFDHVILAIFENHASGEVLGSGAAPWMDSLAASGANFTNSYAVTHPSQPNYLDLFSGSDQGVVDDTCPHTVGTGSLASQLIASGRTFVGWSESLPAPGSLTCGAAGGAYARRHAPWTNFSNLPATVVGRPLSTLPTNYTLLPTVSWIVPNTCHDMHNCSVGTGDAWAKANLAPYAHWATTHNSLLIVTFDEDDHAGGGNHVATIFAGAHVLVGSYPQAITHFTVLRTIEAMYGLAPLGKAAACGPASNVFG